MANLLDPPDVWIRDEATLQRVAPLAGWSKLTLRLRKYAASQWELQFPSTTVDGYSQVLFGRGVLIDSSDGLTRFLSGRIDAITDDSKNGLIAATVSGPDDTEWIDAWRLAHPYPSGAAAGGTYPQTDDVRTGACETVMLAYIDANAGPGAVPARQVPYLTVPTSLGRGGTVTGRARMAPLGDLLRTLGTAGGGWGFRVQQPKNTGGLDPRADLIERRVTILPPATASNGTFSPDRDNLGDWTRDRLGPKANVAYVGGSGSDATRTFALLDQSDATFGRRERFVGGPNSTTAAELIQAGAVDLADQGATIRVDVELFDGAAARYGTDWGLSSIVNVELSGVLVALEVREVEIVWTAGATGIATPLVGDSGGLALTAEQRDSLLIGRRLAAVEAR